MFAQIKNVGTFVAGLPAKFRTKAAANKAALVRGSVLAPLDHPSYSVEKREAIAKAHATFLSTVKGAATRRDNAIAAL